MRIKEEFTYHVASEFSRFPGGRKRANGSFSGEEFREDVTLPLLEKYEFITFDLSGSAGYSSGFLDEAFGEIGALLPIDEVNRRIKIIACDDPEAIDIAWGRINDANKEKSRQKK